MTRPHLVLAGGSGFLGRAALSKWSSDWRITVLSRQARSLPGADVVTWDGATLGPWAAAVDGASAVINLAGRSVDCRYHDRNRREILESRVLSTKVLGEAIAHAATPPPVWLNSSTATIYRHALDRPMDEASGDLGVGFSVEVARAWEEALFASPTPDTRKVALRSAFVLGTGGPLAILARLTRLGLGGSQGPGNQFMSWIHETDWLRAIDFLIERSDLSGVFNLTSPHPLPNCDFMKLLRQACRVPFGMPTPSPLIRLGTMLMRTESELVLKSRRVIPGRLVDEGFEFTFPELSGALENLIGAGRPLAEWQSKRQSARPLDGRPDLESARP